MGNVKEPDLEERLRKRKGEIVLVQYTLGSAGYKPELMCGKLEDVGRDEKNALTFQLGCLWELRNPRFHLARVVDCKQNRVY